MPDVLSNRVNLHINLTKITSFCAVNHFQKKTTNKMDSFEKKKWHGPMWQSANPNPHLNLTLSNPNNGRSFGTSVSGHMGLTPFWTVISSPMKSLTNTWAKSQHCDLPPGRTRKIMTEVNLNEFVHFFRWGLLLNKVSVCRLWPWKWETNWKKNWLYDC